MKTLRGHGLAFQLHFGWGYGFDFHISTTMVALTAWFFVFRIVFRDFERLLVFFQHQLAIEQAKVKAYEDITSVRVVLKDSGEIGVAEEPALNVMPRAPGAN